MKFNIIIKSNNVNCSNILNRFNNKKINILILFVFYAQNKCYNCLSNCSLQQSAFVKRYFISLLNNFSLTVNDFYILTILNRCIILMRKDSILDAMSLFETKKFIQ